MARGLVLSYYFYLCCCSTVAKPIQISFCSCIHCINERNYRIARADFGDNLISCTRKKEMFVYKANEKWFALSSSPSPSTHRSRYEAIAFHISLQTETTHRIIMCLVLSVRRTREWICRCLLAQRDRMPSTSFRRFGEYTQLYTASHQSYKSSHVVRFDDEIRN